MHSKPSDRHRTVERVRASRYRLITLALVVCMAGGPVNGFAEQDQNVKAAFVFNFVRFTEWPAQRFAHRNTPLSLCVWTPDARLSESMRALAGRAVDERPVRVTEVDRQDELGQCHALFIADSSPRASAPAWLRRAESLDVLTIGDGDGFAALGGMIGLVSDGPRMRFDINDKAVKRSGLKLGSQLYQLGRPVAEGLAR